MSKVSVIVPVHKAEKWVDECLASIKNQTYKDIELIVVEDPQGIGAGATRNKGLERSTGEFLVFCDADDYLEPNAIEKLVSASAGVDWVVGSFRKFGEFEQIVSHETRTFNRQEIAQYIMGNLLNPRSNQMLSGCWAKLFRQRRAGLFPSLRTAEDMAFNFDYLRCCGSVRFISDIVYNNRKRTGSLSTTFDENEKNGLFGFLEALDGSKRFLRHYYEEERVERAIDNSKVYHSMLYFMRIADQLGLSMRETLLRLYP